MSTLLPLDPPPGRATRPAARLLVTTVAAFALALGVLSLLDRTPAGPPAPPAPTVGASRGGTDTGAEVRRLQAAVRMAPEAAGPRAQLAAAYLQRARETGDPSFYVRAEGLVRSALARDPGNAEATVQAGTLALARHDFSSALVLAQRAQRQSGGAGAVAPYPVLVDALVELGRYDEAERALQAMVDLKPNLAAYARVSYLRELHGDLDGAAAAMRDAIAAGGPVPEHVASLQTLLAGLELARGRPGRPGARPMPRWPPSPGTSRRSPRTPACARAAAISGVPSRRGGGSSRGGRCPSTSPPSARPSWPRAAARRPAATWRWSESSGGCRPPAASTPTSSGRRSRPTTAILAAASRSGGAAGRRRPACAPRMRSAGRSPGRAARARAWHGPTARCGSARSIRSCASTRA